MAFDPSQFGATPVSTSSGGFDPSQFGATPVQSAPTVPQNVKPDSFMSLATKFAGTALGSQIPGFNSLSGAVGGPTLLGTASSLAGYGASAIGDQFNSGVSQMGSALDTQYGQPLSLNPLVPLEKGAQFGAGLVNSASSLLAPIFKPVGDAINYVGNKIGDIPAVQNFASSPAGNVTSRIAGDVANLDTIAGGATAAPDTFAALAKGPKAIANTAANATDGVSATLMNKVARINPSDAEAFSHMSGGQTPGEFLDARGIYGSAENVTSQLLNRFTQAKNAVDTALAQLPGLYKNPAVESALTDVVKHAEDTSANGAPSPYLTQARSLLGKLQSDGLTMSEVNAAKRLYESTVKLNYIKDGVSAGIERANNIDSSIRTWQQDMADRLGFKNIRQLNKETQLAKSLIDAIGKKQNAQIGNNLVGLTDWVVASGIPHDPASLALLLGKKVLGSSTGKGALAKILSRGDKLSPPSAEFGSMRDTGQLDLPGPGGSSPASNLPPVMHMDGGLTPQDSLGINTGPTYRELSGTDNTTGAGTLPENGRQPSPTTASKPSAAVDTSTGSAPIGKEGVSAPKADTSGPFDGVLKSKGKDTLGRDIPNWSNATVYHSTDAKSAADIRANGYRILGNDEQYGYYGRAVSFTPNLEYTKQFGGELTKGKVSPNAKILNLNDEKDWAIFQKATEGLDTSQMPDAVRKAGYDGVYDAGAGDLFIYNPKVIKNIDAVSSSPSIPKGGKPKK